MLHLHVNDIYFVSNIRFIYGKPDVPKASPEISSEVYSELADLRRNEDWDAAVQLVVKAGDPKAQLVAVNDWYRLRRSLEIIKVSLWCFLVLFVNVGLSLSVFLCSETKTQSYKMVIYEDQILICCKSYRSLDS